MTGTDGVVASEGRWGLLAGLFSTEHAKSDVAAGLTVAAMLVPQAMAYAQLAGLPPEIGLYASTVPLLVYALLGTSRQLSAGPVAIVSLVTATALAQVAEEGTAGYVTAAAVLAGMVGAVHIVVGVLRLGFLVRLLSHPVLTGFTAAAAVIIGTSQLRHLFGTQPDDAEGWVATVAAFIGSLGGIDALTVLVGVGSLGLMIGVRRWRSKAPVALVAVVIAIIVSRLADLGGRDVDIVGDIPAGLPPVTIPSLDDLGDLVGTLLPSALTITLVGVLEAIAVSRVYAREHRYDLDANRELVALGAANVATGFFGGYPLGGAISRTAVNNDAGARTRFAGIVTAIAVVIVLVVLTPLFTDLPQAVLAAIVLLAVSGLFDVASAREIYRVRQADVMTMALAFIATLVLGVDRGILVAVVGSVALIAQRLMRPHVAVLGRVSDTDRWRDIERYDDARQQPGVSVVRFDTSLNFLNVEVMKDQIRRFVAQDPHALVLDLSSVNDIDSSAADTLSELLDELENDGVEVHMATYRGPITEILDRTDIPDRVAGFYENVADAARAAASGPQPPGSATHHVRARLTRRRQIPGSDRADEQIS